MGSQEPHKTRVAIIGSGMAGLVAAYLLRNDSFRRFKVEVFESQDRLSLDSASHTVDAEDNEERSTQDRVDLPMRAFAGGFYEGLKRMYDYFGIRYASPRFIYAL